MRYGGNQLMGMLCNHMMEKVAELKMTQYRNRLPPPHPPPPQFTPHPLAPARGAKR